MTSVYLAGRYARRDEFRALLPQLQSLGVKCTSRWLFETAPLNVQLKNVPKLESEQIAQQDIEDIDSASAFLFFAEDQNTQPPRGGRHVEFGYALARGKHMHVIGARENIFHYLPGVTIHPELSAFFEFLVQNQTCEVGL